jgi:hypothetical protein
LYAERFRRLASEGADLAGEARMVDAMLPMLFVAAATEEQVLRRVAAHLRPDGFAVIGFAADRGYELADFDRHAAVAGLMTEHRFATWDLRPWRAASPFSVTVLRR